MFVVCQSLCNMTRPHNLKGNAVYPTPGFVLMRFVKLECLPKKAGRKMNNFRIFTF